MRFVDLNSKVRHSIPYSIPHVFDCCIFMRFVAMYSKFLFDSWLLCVLLGVIFAPRELHPDITATFSFIWSTSTGVRELYFGMQRRWRKNTGGPGQFGDTAPSAAFIDHAGDWIWSPYHRWVAAWCCVHYWIGYGVHLAGAAAAASITAARWGMKP